MTTYHNKFAQSNLGRGPCRGAVAHICRKVLIGYNGAPQIRPHPSTHPTYDAKRHPDLIRRFSTMHWTDRQTHARTYQQMVHAKV